MATKSFLTEKSTRISSIEWDSETQDLRVKYKRGGTYIYRNVPEALYDLLAVAPSVGKAINANLIGRYEYTKQS